MDVGQKYILSPILSALYITSIFHIFEKRTKNLLTPIPVSILSFVDNGLCVSQEKNYKNPNAKLFCSYSIILFNQFILVIKHDKSEPFHFLRSTKNISGCYNNLAFFIDIIVNHKNLGYFSITRVLIQRQA